MLYLQNKARQSDLDVRLLIRTFLDRNGLTEKRQGGKTGGVPVEMQIKFCNLSLGFSKISGV